MKDQTQQPAHMLQSLCPIAGPLSAPGKEMCILHHKDQRKHSGSIIHDT